MIKVRSKTLVSTISCAFWAGIFQIAGKKSRLACENCMLHVQWKVLTRNIFLKGCSFWKLISEIVQKLFALAVSLFSGNLSKLLFLCPWQCSNYSVSLLSGNSVETTVFVSMRMLKIYINFLTKLFRPILFFECGQKMFGLLKIFQQGGQNFIPLVQRNLRGSDVFDRNLYSYHFWKLSGKLSEVGQNFVF